MRYSIVICAYNAATRLPETLRHLAALTYDPTAWEVLLVDNASTDGTAAVAMACWQSTRAGVSLRVVTEPTPGLTAARWRGAASAHGEILVFCDDDNWLAPDYLSVADDAIRQFGDEAVLGGASTPDFEIGWEQVPPIVFRYLPMLAVGAATVRREDVTRTIGCVMGAGMVVPARAFQDLRDAGFVQQLKDRTGSALTTGGDTELCFALTLLGWRIVSIPDLLFRHRIPGARCDASYIERLVQRNAEADRALAWYQFLRVQTIEPVSWLGRWLRGLWYLWAFPECRGECLRFLVFGRRAWYHMLPVHLLRRRRA